MLPVAAFFRTSLFFALVTRGQFASAADKCRLRDGRPAEPQDADEPSAAGLAEPLAGVPWLAAYSGNLQRKAAMAASPDAPAYATCAAVTTGSALPFRLALGAALAVVGSACVYACSLGSPLLTLVWQLLVFSHSAQPEGT